ncbi:LytTR family DNA-binding domain-containing protein [Clostridium sp.]|uniref:LytTR family DNA-binding domain-containing protein n=1 Tax=Clostridium sp. TaxID=1506 RepID=UPI003992AD78
MKVKIKKNEKIKEIEVTIACSKINNEVQELLKSLNKVSKKISVIDKNGIKLIMIKDILYMESVDKKTFVYTFNNIYESKLKLYEIENELREKGFMRISKKTIINLSQVSNISPDLSRRLILTLENGEKIIVSRQYVLEFKRELGL